MCVFLPQKVIQWSQLCDVEVHPAELLQIKMKEELRRKRNTFAAKECTKEEIQRNRITGGTGRPGNQSSVGI